MRHNHTVQGSQPDSNIDSQNLLQNRLHILKAKKYQVLYS